jgi:hypothetical protein
MKYFVVILAIAIGIAGVVAPPPSGAVSGGFGGWASWT